MCLKMEKFMGKYTHLQYTVGIECRDAVGTCEQTQREHITRCMMGKGHMTTATRTQLKSHGLAGHQIQCLYCDS